MVHVTTLRMQGVWPAGQSFKPAPATLMTTPCLGYLQQVRFRVFFNLLIVLKSGLYWRPFGSLITVGWKCASGVTARGLSHEFVPCWANNGKHLSIVDILTSGPNSVFCSMNVAQAGLSLPKLQHTVITRDVFLRWSRGVSFTMVW